MELTNRMLHFEIKIIDFTRKHRKVTDVQKWFVFLSPYGIEPKFCVDSESELRTANSRKSRLFSQGGNA